LAKTGAERLLGQGDFVVVAKGQVTRMQAAYLGPREAEELVQLLGCSSRVALLAPSGNNGTAEEQVGLGDRIRSQLRRIK
jgi:hypothetical protein